MKNLTWQNPEQLFVAQELINKVKSKCCGIKAKEEIYRVLRNMNREDKKTAQQHLLNSYLNGGKMNDPQMAFILNEILTECGMIDKQI